MGRLLPLNELRQAVCLLCLCLCLLPLNELRRECVFVRQAVCNCWLCFSLNGWCNLLETVLSTYMCRNSKNRAIIGFRDSRKTENLFGWKSTGNSNYSIDSEASKAAHGHQVGACLMGIVTGRSTWLWELSREEALVCGNCHGQKKHLFLSFFFFFFFGKFHFRCLFLIQQPHNFILF